jgi:hypothetical protein
MRVRDLLRLWCRGEPPAFETLDAAGGFLRDLLADRPARSRQLEKSEWIIRESRRLSRLPPVPRSLTLIKKGAVRRPVRDLGIHR